MSKAKKVVDISKPEAAKKPTPKHILTAQQRAALAEKARKQWADKNGKLRNAQRHTGQSQPVRPPKDAVAIIEYVVGTFGSTKEQIAAAFGISVDLFNNWLKRHEEIRDVFDRSKSLEYSKLTGMLFNRAMNGDATSAMFLLKIRHNARDSGPIQEDAKDPVSTAAKIRSALEAMKKVDGE
ncbi:MAG: hypothetical protein IT167_29540 [Bryobacterales bacterium]|nr:hypothetical protein [Bryobacterales bacterium]